MFVPKWHEMPKKKPYVSVHAEHLARAHFNDLISKLRVRNFYGLILNVIFVIGKLFKSLVQAITSKNCQLQKFIQN